MTVVSSNSTSITVRSNGGCSISSGTINVSVVQNGIACNTSKNVTINGTGSSLPPNTIHVLNPNWKNGKTCPNTMLELEVIDNNQTSQTTYEWSISGATFISGQGTSTAFVRTPSFGTSYLTFRVRARRGNCSYSSWTSIYGNSSSSNCGGSGGGGFDTGIFAFRSSENSLQIKTSEKVSSLEEKIDYQIIDLHGRILQQGNILSENSEINIDKLKGGIFIMKLYYTETKKVKSIKFVK